MTREKGGASFFNRTRRDGEEGNDAEKERDREGRERTASASSLQEQYKGREEKTEKDTRERMNA